MTERQEPTPDVLPALTDEQVEAFQTATGSLRAQAAGHALLGRFKLIDRAEGYYQDFREVYFPPTPTPDLGMIANNCQAIMGQWPDGTFHFDRLRASYAERRDDIDQAKEIMNSGGRVLLITPHRELADVAMAMAAFQCEVGDPGLVEHTRIFVGPIIKELEIAGFPAVPALQLSTGVFVGFPDTDSTKQRIELGEISPEVKHSANSALLRTFVRQIKNNEIEFAAIAASGSTDTETDTEIIMKPVSQATEGIVRRFDAILPVALVMDASSAAFEVGKLTRIGPNETIHDVMEYELSPIYMRVSGKKVSYKRPPAAEQAAA